MNKCEYCDSIFSTSKILLSHQKKAKFCLKKQQKLKIINEFNCEHCDLQCFSDIELENHKNICIQILKLKIKDLEENNKKDQQEKMTFQLQLQEKDHQISSLQNKIENMSFKIRFLLAKNHVEWL